MNETDYGREQLLEACDLLAHYHLEHTNDKVTRIKGPNVDLYIISDPEWRSEVERVLSPAFSRIEKLGKRQTN